MEELLLRQNKMRRLIFLRIMPIIHVSVSGVCTGIHFKMVARPDLNFCCFFFFLDRSLLSLTKTKKETCKTEFQALEYVKDN